MVKNHKKSFQITLKDVIILGGLILFLAIAIHLYSAHYYLLKRWQYVFQAPFAKRTIVCSQGSPGFMPTIMENLISEQKSMNNQLVFYSSNGQKFHCESGWENGFRGSKPITVDSRFRYASVSKVITSAMVLSLINEGKIALDTKLVDIIKISEPVDKRVKDITVEMLLQHSAGFDRLKTYTPMLTMGKKPWCPTSIDELAKTKLDFEPNTQFQYSNVGYCLLGEIVAKVTGKSFQQAVEEEYGLEKRGIRFVGDGFLNDEIEYDYRYEDFYSRSYTQHFDFKDSLYAVGGLSGSAKAMAELMIDILKQKPFNVLSRNNTPCAIQLLEGCYGYAMLPYQKAGKEMILYGKSGFFPGVNTDIFVDSQGGVLAVYRGASSPNYKVMDNLKLKIYDDLENFYHK